MKKPKLPLCPICEMEILNPHASCEIFCFVCQKLIPSLVYYSHNEETNEFHRFCSLECEKVFKEKNG